MAQVISIPKVNPIKFYHQSEVFSSREGSGDNYKSFKPWHNSKTIDEGFYLENVFEWLNAKKYYQPWQNSDVICLQFVGVNKISSTIPYFIKLIDCKGVTAKAIIATWKADIGTKSIYSVEVKLWDVPEGVYAVQIRFQDIINAGVPWNYWISEPIEVKPYHKGTKLIKYKNSKNDFGVYYELDARFMIRVHAELIDFKPDSSFEVYEDDPKNLEMLGGYTYRDYSLSIGGNGHGVPNWLHDKIEAITIHDYISIDGLRITRNDTAKIEAESNKSQELKALKLSVRETYAKDSLETSSFVNADLMPVTESEYFYVQQIEFPNSGPGVTITIENYFKGINQFVNYLNQEISYIYGLTWSTDGCYVAISTENNVTLFVDNSTDESNVDGATVNGLIENYIEIDVEISPSETDVTVSFVNGATVSTDYAVFYNDTTPAEIGTDSTGTFDIVHTFLKSCKFLLFCPVIDQIQVTGDAVIKSLGLNIGDAATSFELSSNGLKNINNNIFLYAAQMSNFTFSNNKLSMYEVDKLVRMAVDANAAGSLQASCTIDVTGQSTTDDKGIQYLIQKLSQQNITFNT